MRTVKTILVPLFAALAVLSSAVPAAAEAAPPSPASPQVTGGGDSSLTVTWTAGEEAGGEEGGGDDILGGGGGTWFDVTAIGGAANVTVTVSGVETATITGLENGTGYRVTVTAVNGTGESAAVYAPGTWYPSALPGAVGSLTASRNEAGTSVSLSWSAPANAAGNAIGKYEIYTTSPDAGANIPSTVALLRGVDGSSPGTEATVTGLTAGKSYRFTVAAFTLAGKGANTSVETLVRRPNRLTGVRVSGAGEGSLTVSWNTPTVPNGGSEVDGIAVTLYNISDLNTPIVTTGVAGSALSATLTGLVNGVPHVAVVIATNSDGSSTPAYSTSLLDPWPAYPGPVPGVVNDINVTRGADGRTATITFTRPTNSPLLSISEYTATVVTLVGAPWTSGMLHRAAYAENPDGSLEIIVSGLNPYADYRVRVNARSMAGKGPVTVVNVPVPSDRPGNHPINYGAKYVANRNGVSVYWKAPLNAEGATYVVQQLVDGSWTTATTTSGLSYFANGLAAGTQWRVAIVKGAFTRVTPTFTATS